MKRILLAILFLFVLNTSYAQQEKPYLLVLGTLQDGGSPHIGCTKSCCATIDSIKKVSSIGLIDPISKKNFLFDASPDMVSQWRMLNETIHQPIHKMPDGIFLTHAHIGHYTGLMYLGREALGSKNVQVFTMPRMKTFLETNGPWSQLVSLNNIQLLEMREREFIKLSEQISVEAVRVPHRDEFSETVGYIIKGPQKKALFIPDIDKWEKWDRDLIAMIKEVDYAFLDGTFYDTKELNNRKMSEVPHPCVIETMEKLSTLSSTEKNKLWFIHLNHTNPLLNKNSEQYRNLMGKGFHVAEMKMQFLL